MKQVILNYRSESFTFHGCAAFFDADTLKQDDVEA